MLLSGDWRGEIDKRNLEEIINVEEVIIRNIIISCLSYILIIVLFFHVDGMNMSGMQGEHDVILTSR